MTIHNKDLTDMNITIADLEQRAANIRFEIDCGERKIKDARAKVKRWENTCVNLMWKLREVRGEIENRIHLAWLKGQ